MSDNTINSQTIIYEIKVAGVLDKRWQDWFEGFSIESQGHYTLFCGAVADQAALHSVIRKIRDLGLPLISVTQATPAR